MRDLLLPGAALVLDVPGDDVAVELVPPVSAVDHAAGLLCGGRSPGIGGRVVVGLQAARRQAGALRSHQAADDHRASHADAGAHNRAPRRGAEPHP